MAREAGGEGFINIDEEVEEHIEEHQEVLKNEELEVLVKSSTEEEEIEVEPAMWTLKKFGEVFRMAQILKEKIMDYDPMIKCSIKVTCMITEALQPIQQMFNELKRPKQQLPIMMFFHKVEEKKCPLSKTLSHQHHLHLTSSSHHCFRLLSILHLLKKMILMTLLPFHQKVNSQAQHHNAYTITPLHLLNIGIVLSSYHHRHHHHQSSLKQQDDQSSR